MSSQLAIDFEARARAADPATSHAAAERVNVRALEAKVLEALRANGQFGRPYYAVGMTTKEIAAVTGIERCSVSPRMRPLVRKGELVESELRRDGGIVWRLPSS